MSVGPRFTGDNHVPITDQFLDDSNNALNITTATLAMRYSLNGDAGHGGTGTFVVVSAATGQFTYQFSAADVGLPGTLQIQFIATFPDGTASKADPISEVIYQAL